MWTVASRKMWLAGHYRPTLFEHHIRTHSMRQTGRRQSTYSRASLLKYLTSLFIHRVRKHKPFTKHAKPMIIELCKLPAIGPFRFHPEKLMCSAYGSLRQGEISAAFKSHIRRTVEPIETDSMSTKWNHPSDPAIPNFKSTSLVTSPWVWAAIKR